MNLLITSPMREKDLDELKKYFDEVVYRPWTLNGGGYDAATTLQMLRDAQADAFISELDDVNAEVMEQYHDLIFIGDCRANPANVDVAAATKYRIPLLCTPARNAEAVAELLVGALVCFMRNVPAAVRWAKDGKWVQGTMPYYMYMGHEIYNKKIGFVGFGAVGRAAARILSSFGAEIWFYDPFVASVPEGYEKCEKLEVMFAESDIVSVHLPVLPSTRGMVTKDLIERMKSTAVFVNTSRSAVVDMDAVYTSLKEKKIAGAVLDVYDTEPAEGRDLEILRMDNVLATPHICGATYEVTDHQSEIITNRIEKWFEKKDLERIVFNKAVLE